MDEDGLETRSVQGAHQSHHHGLHAAGLEISHDGMQVRGHARGKRFVLAASTAFAIETAASTLAPPAPRMCHRTFQLLKTPAGE